jgi:hypothetical protein
MPLFGGNKPMPRPPAPLRSGPPSFRVIWPGGKLAKATPQIKSKMN